MASILSPVVKAAFERSNEALQKMDDDPGAFNDRGWSGQRRVSMNASSDTVDSNVAMRVVSSRVYRHVAWSRYIRSLTSQAAQSN